MPINAVSSPLTADELNELIYTHDKDLPRLDYASDLNAAWLLKNRMTISAFNHLIHFHHHNKASQLALALTRAYVTWKGWPK